MYTIFELPNRQNSSYVEIIARAFIIITHSENDAIDECDECCVHASYNICVARDSFDGRILRTKFMVASNVNVCIK